MMFCKQVKNIWNQSDEIKQYTNNEKISKNARIYLFIFCTLAF